MKKKGITMIELIAVIAMVSIIGLGVMSLFLSQNKLFTMINKETFVQDDARLVLSAMENDLKIGKNMVIPTTITENDNFIINSTNYTVPQKDSIKGKVVYGFTKKQPTIITITTPTVSTTTADVDTDFAYALYGKKMVILEGVKTPVVGLIPASNNLVERAVPSVNVNSIVITKETGVATSFPSLQYKIDLQFSRGTEIDKFSSIVVKR